MKTPWPWVIIIIIGIIGLFVISRFTAPKPVTNEQKTETPEQTVAKTPTATEEIPKIEPSSLPAGWQNIDGGNFTINVPQTWVISKDTASGKILRLASAISQEAYTDPNIVVINFEEFSKSKKTLEQLKAEKTKDQSSAAAAVEFMKTNAIAPFNEITINDIKTSTEEIVLNDGATATKNIFQCLKPCYIEGGAQTLTQYFLANDQTVYYLSSYTGIDEKADALRLVAEQIIKSFQTK